MTARQALEIAMRCEQKAHAFFVEALPHVQDPQVITLFAELRDEEVHHQELVQREMRRLPAGADTSGASTHFLGKRLRVRPDVC
jgi:rubrerythrin